MVAPLLLRNSFSRAVVLDDLGHGLADLTGIGFLLRWEPAILAPHWRKPGAGNRAAFPRLRQRGEAPHARFLCSRSPALIARWVQTFADVQGYRKRFGRLRTYTLGSSFDYSGNISMAGRKSAEFCAKGYHRAVIIPWPKYDD